jgi:hypothetical protein
VIGTPPVICGSFHWMTIVAPLIDVDGAAGVLGNYAANIVIGADVAL